MKKEITHNPNNSDEGVVEMVRQLYTGYYTTPFRDDDSEVMELICMAAQELLKSMEK